MRQIFISERASNNWRIPIRLGASMGNTNVLGWLLEHEPTSFTDYVKKKMNED